MGYFIDIHDTNRFAGPFSDTWEIQKWYNEHDYGPDEWSFTGESGPYDLETLKEKVVNDEIDVPCGKRAFDEDEMDTMVVYDEVLDTVEVTVWATCTECGYRHMKSEHVRPTP